MSRRGEMRKTWQEWREKDPRGCKKFENWDNYRRRKYRELRSRMVSIDDCRIKTHRNGKKVRLTDILV